MSSVVFALKIKRFCGDDCIDSTDLVTYFPADFKQIIRFDKFCFHLSLIKLLSFPGRSPCGFRPGILHKARIFILCYFFVVFLAAGFFALGSAFALAFGAAFTALVVFFAGAFFTFAAAKLTSETEIASSTRKIKSLKTFI